jgi:hypothetical protein
MLEHDFVSECLGIAITNFELFLCVSSAGTQQPQAERFTVE